MKGILLLFLTLTLLSCSTVRLYYKSEFETDDGQKGIVEYYRSYKVETTQKLCILTGIIWGGACWTYLFYPNKKQSDQIKKDVRQEVLSKIGHHRYLLNNESIDRAEWVQKDPYFSLKWTKLE